MPATQIQEPETEYGSEPEQALDVTEDHILMNCEGESETTLTDATTRNWSVFYRDKFPKFIHLVNGIKVEAIARFSKPMWRRDSFAARHDWSLVDGVLDQDAHNVRKRGRKSTLGIRVIQPTSKEKAE